jgi:hypothetical protein
MKQLGALHGMPLADFPHLFATLAIPAISNLSGRFSGQFTGPIWVRLAAGPVLWLGGLPGWWGKEFADRGRSKNLRRRDGEIVPSVPVRLETRPSLIDGRPGVSLLYPPDARPPLPWVIDELRWLDEGETTLLGMTMLSRLGLQRLPVPFLLHRIGGPVTL